MSHTQLLGFWKTRASMSWRPGLVFLWKTSTMGLSWSHILKELQGHQSCLRQIASTSYWMKVNYCHLLTLKSSSSTLVLWAKIKIKCSPYLLQSLPPGGVWRAKTLDFSTIRGSGNAGQKQKKIGKPHEVDKIVGDGNCLFRAISKEVTMTEDQHHVFRAAGVTTLKDAQYASLFHDYLGMDVKV